MDTLVNMVQQVSETLATINAVGSSFVVGVAALLDAKTAAKVGSVAGSPNRENIRLSGHKYSLVVFVGVLLCTFGIRYIPESMQTAAYTGAIMAMGAASVYSYCLMMTNAGLRGATVLRNIGWAALVLIWIWIGTLRR